MLKNETLNERYESAVSLMQQLTEHFQQPVVMDMDERFEAEQSGNAPHYFGSQKAKDKSVQQAQLVSSEMYEHQLNMKNLNTSLRFVLNNAHNNTSYKALARYFAQYAFYAQKLNRMGKNSNHPFVVEYVKNKEFLHFNFFDLMFETVNAMQQTLQQRMKDEPEKYTLHNHDEDVYTELDAQDIKDTYKAHLKKLKEEDEQ